VQDDFREFQTTRSRFPDSDVSKLGFFKGVSMAFASRHSIRTIPTQLGYSAAGPILWSLLVVTGTLLFHSAANAHPPGKDGRHTAHNQDTTNTPAPPRNIGTALILPEIDGPKPWSDKPALTDDDRFSIAIMTDNTGGHRPGIWMKAVERLNWLRPDFVVSVGDLIEGYTENDAEISRQWTEFLGFIDKMEMKFFFVPGNHDVTNPKLHAIWRKQFGREWYSFDYKGVHFVCLNSEDPSTHIGDEQLAWLADDLQQNSQARWTLMFLHKPIWTTAERDQQAGNKDSSNWTKVAELLGDRPHTVFAGHVHHYVQYVRNGREYYSLATTGGSSPLRGVPYGEFDHVAWLTMERDGPRVANLLLDGVLPADVVTESSIEHFRKFLQSVRFEIEPIFISDDQIQRGDIRISLRNDYDQRVTVRGKIEGLPLVGLSMESALLELSVAPGDAVTQTFRFEMKEPVDLARFRATMMTAQVTSDESPAQRAEWTIPVVIDKEYQLHGQTATVDGDLQEWDGPWWASPTIPALVGAKENWQGEQDCSFATTARYDDKNLYFAFRVKDEQVVAGDAITVVIDTRPPLTRLTSNQIGNESIALRITAPTSHQLERCEVAGVLRPSVENVVAMGRKTEDGYEVELAAPLIGILRSQGLAWGSLQAGVRVADVDTPGESKVELLWRANENVRDNRPMAHLIRK
jgi:hypothetical protein